MDLSNWQITLEPGLCASDMQIRAEQLRCGLVASVPAMELKGEMEIDEVRIMTGRKGWPAAVAKRGGSDSIACWQEPRAAAR